MENVNVFALKLWVKGGGPGQEGSLFWPGSFQIWTRSCYILEWELFENFFLADLWRGNPSQTPLIALWQQLQANITSSKSPSHFYNHSSLTDWPIFGRLGCKSLFERSVPCAVVKQRSTYMPPSHHYYPHYQISILMLQFSSFFIISPVSPPYCSQQVWK